MSKRTDRVQADAQRVERRLRAAGEHMDAEAIARLRSSHAAACATAKRLHRDNMDLRQRLGLPSFADANGIKVAG